jgi:uncharacterized protein involved in exopolysaccharide biosynthesis
LENNQTQDSLSEEISFKEILINLIKWFRYIVSKWIVIVLIAIVGGVAGFLYANSKPLKYRAVSTFVLQELGTSNVQGNDFVSILGFNVPEAGGLFQGENLLQLYRTRFMIKKTLLSKVPDSKNEYVIDRYLKINGLREAWKKLPNLKNINFFKKGNKSYTRLQDSLITAFVDDINFNYLQVNKEDRLNFIRVEVRSTDEEFAKLFNDQIVRTVNEYYIQTKTKRSADNLRLLQHQTDSIRAALNGAMYKVASSSSMNLNPAREVLRVPSQRSQVGAETNRSMLYELVRDLEVSKMSLRKETPLIQIMDEPVFPLPKFRESRAKALIVGTLMAAFLTIALYSVLYLYKRVLE